MRCENFIFGLTIWTELREVSMSCGVRQLIQNIPPEKWAWWQWMKSMSGSEGFTPGGPCSTCNMGAVSNESWGKLSPITIITHSPQGLLVDFDKIGVCDGVLCNTHLNVCGESGAVEKRFLQVLQHLQAREHTAGPQSSG